MKALADIEIIELSVNQLGSRPTNFEFLGAGMFSSAYRLQIGGEQLVLRIGSNYTPFLKDEWAFYLFKDSPLQVPEVYAKGPIGEYFFCFSSYIAGSRFDQLSTIEIERSLNALFDAHDYIAQIELPVNTGFGFLDPAGHGIYNSWHDALTNFGDWPATILSRKGEAFLGWDSVFRETILDEGLARRSMEKINSLLPYCPEVRGLIHGDFGFDNVLMRHGNVSAILDWAECRCGDPLYDIASLQCHGSQHNYRDSYRERLVYQNRLPRNYDERMDCYMIHTILCNCWLDAQRGFYDYYEDGKKVLERLL